MEKKQILTILSENLIDLMHQTELSITQLARVSKISPGTISKIISGSTSITIPTALSICEGLGVELKDLLKGLSSDQLNSKLSINPNPEKNLQLEIGILSINNKRFTCIKNSNGKVIGNSELEHGLDLTETSGNLMQLIHESIAEALPNGRLNQSILKQASLKLVPQSYEFEDTRQKFMLFARKSFKNVLLLPDWQITYLAAFKNTQGISLVVDKGVSLSYLDNHGRLKKIGGWKFPVYDIGGENWLGVKTIHHTIEASEGYIPKSKLSQDVLSKFSGKIEKITETCFKGSKDPDIYCLFAEILLRHYFTGDEKAKSLIEEGFNHVYRSIYLVDGILGKEVNIALNGSLANIYKPFFNKSRLIEASSDTDKVLLLAGINPGYLNKNGIGNI